MLEPISFVQTCDVDGCTRERRVSHDDLNRGGWEHRRDVPSHPVDVCPDHMGVPSTQILFGPPMKTEHRPSGQRPCN
jgi:hypothetical protein